MQCRPAAVGGFTMRAIFKAARRPAHEPPRPRYQSRVRRSTGATVSGAMTLIAAGVRRRAVLWNRRRLHRRLMSRMPRYEDWTRHDTPDAAQLQRLHDRVAALAGL